MARADAPSGSKTGRPFFFCSVDAVVVVVAAMKPGLDIRRFDMKSTVSPVVGRLRYYEYQGRGKPSKTSLRTYPPTDVVCDGKLKHATLMLLHRNDDRSQHELRQPRRIVPVGGTACLLEYKGQKRPDHGWTEVMGAHIQISPCVGTWEIMSQHRMTETDRPTKGESSSIGCQSLVQLSSC